jgi:glycosyltransferase involved in cell wall biosynthesis
MLARLTAFVPERFYLSPSRAPATALASIPFRWPQLAAAQRTATLIHCHGDVASVIALPILRSHPAVMTGQGLHMLRRLEGVRRSLMNHAVAAVVARCRYVICSSAEERAELARIVPLDNRSKLRVIYNGIEPPAHIDERERLLIRGQLGIAPESVLGLFVGQLEPRKAPMLAALAAMRAHAAGAPFVLAMAGDGPQADQVRAMAGEAVKVLGYRKDVPRLLSAADVFVQSSEREGMSFALLEAMSHGLAVVAADSSSNPEAVGDAGLLFAAGDGTALTRALLRLSSDSALRSSLRERARTRALACFSPAGFLAASESVYQQALGRFTAPDQSAAAPLA